MKALILNGEEMEGLCLNEISKSIKEELVDNNFEVEEIILKEKDIADCLGCFKCWVKTPGVCIIDDYGREAAAELIDSDILVYLTPIVFGSYSYQLKKALDRMIPLISPYFKKINGEIHHKKRYRTYPSILGIGIIDKENNNQSQIFKELVERNSINFHSPHFKSKVFLLDDNFDDKELKNAVETFSKKVGEGNE